MLFLFFGFEGEELCCIYCVVVVYVGVYYYFMEQFFFVGVLKLFQFVVIFVIEDVCVECLVICELLGFVELWLFFYVVKFGGLFLVMLFLVRFVRVLIDSDYCDFDGWIEKG